jgi:8-oxo-dGTP pyrophosphatase MutT (NUDIX family)
VSELRIRPAARAILLDPDDRILLVRFAFPDSSFWATPGGGIEPGELAEEAVRRELLEETGLEPVEIGPVVWTRLHIVPFVGGQWDGQQELYHLVRGPAFTPEPRHTWEQLNAEFVFELRWWTTAELDEATETFAPRRLPELIRDLLRDGPPAEPIDVGV